jgi:hypothetical protein
VTSDSPFNAIIPGKPVLLVLHSPREKCLGILDEISGAGVFLRGLDLDAFDDWLSSVTNNEPFGGPTSLFFPMWRVERLSLDEGAFGVPSLVEQAEKRTGRRAADLFSAP